jgi:hypothetical protein
MKESALIDMQKKQEAIIRVLQEIMNEQQHLTLLAMGVLETIKLMPGYDDAIKALMEKSKAANEEPEKPTLEL